MRELNERRSFSHVTDMLQVARYPTRLLCSEASGSSNASNETNVRRMIDVAGRRNSPYSPATGPNPAASTLGYGDETSPQIARAGPLA